MGLFVSSCFEIVLFAIFVRFHCCLSCLQDFISSIEFEACLALYAQMFYNVNNILHSSLLQGFPFNV